MFADMLDRALGSVHCFMKAFPPESLSGHEAALVAQKMAVGEKLLCAAKLSYAARVEETGSYEEEGWRDAPAWLGAISGGPTGQARSALETTKAIAGSPAAKRAFRAGKLSAPQAAQVARLAGTDEQAVEKLVATAEDDQSTYNDFRQQADRAAQAARSAEDERQRDARIHAARFARLHRGDDGGVAGEFLVDDYDGARIIARVNARANRLYKLAAKEGTPEPHARYMADALVELLLGSRGRGAGSSGGCGGSGGPGGPGTSGGPGGPSGSGPGGSGSGPGSGGAPSTAPGDARQPADDAANAGQDRGPRTEGSGDASGSEAGGADPGPGADADSDPDADPDPDDDSTPGGATESTEPEAQVHVHVSVEALRRGSVEPGERCEITGLGPISVAQARRILGDAYYHLVIDNGVDVYRISKNTRVVSAYIKRALLSRDPECVVPGCDVTYGLQIHHWREDYNGGRGKTELANLARLCQRHHTRITNGAWKLVGGPGHWDFVRVNPERTPPGASPKRPKSARGTKRPPAPSPAPTEPPVDTPRVVPRD